MPGLITFEYNVSTADTKLGVMKMPPAIERSVRRQNIKFMHNRNQFSCEYFQFIRKLASCNIPPPERQHNADKFVSVNRVTNTLILISLCNQNFDKESGLPFNSPRLVRTPQNIMFRNHNCFYQQIKKYDIKMDIQESRHKKTQCPFSRFNLI